MPLESDLDRILEPILKTFQGKLKANLAGEMTTIYYSGSAQMVDWGKTKRGIPITFEGPPIQVAVDYAEKHCAKLVVGIDEETKRRIAQTVSDGIKNKRGIDGLTRDIRMGFADMRTKRARVIARTETNDALSQAFMDRSQEMGVTGKEIVVGDPCEICEANAAEGVVTLDHVFQSGDKRPPFHPNCVCALAPVMGKSG